MFTKNWYKYMYSAISGCIDGSITVRDMLGDNYQATKELSSTIKHSLNIAEDSNGYCYSPSMKYLRKTTKGSMSGVLIGTGMTEPTMDDYCLSGELITTFEYTSTVTSTGDDAGVTMTAVYTITNTGTEAFTVGEICLFAGACNVSSSASTGKYLSILERSILENPVTIPAGGVGQITYTIRMNYPVA